MTSLASLSQFRGPDGRLDQFTTDEGVPDESRDTFLQACLDEATSIITTELGYTLTAAAAGTQTVYGTGTVWLPLPRFTPDSVSLVEQLNGYAVPDYVESGSALRITDSSGVYSIAPYPQLTPRYGYGATWLPGVPYTVTATFGVSADDLVAARLCCLEIAVQLFRFKDAGGSSVIGTEAAVETVRNEYSPIVKRMLGHLRRDYSLVW